jgi:hypothetical protein
MNLLAFSLDERMLAHRGVQGPELDASDATFENSESIACGRAWYEQAANEILA